MMMPTREDSKMAEAFNFGTGTYFRVRRRRYLCSEGIEQIIQIPAAAIRWEAMPSRKKAKGQARKAAKVKNEAAAKARHFAEFVNALERSQIQRLQIRNQNSVPTICMHGFDPFPNDHVCIKFIRAFVREFYTCFFDFVYDVQKTTSHLLLRGLMISLSTAIYSTQDEYSEVWNSGDKMKQVISYFLHNGTMFTLDGEDIFANHSALFARFYEQWLKVEVNKSQACIDWLKVTETYRCIEKHSRVKYFWRRIRCSCLDEAYEEVKSIPKMGVCFNNDCAHRNEEVERSKLRCCSRCRSVNYCSRECQAAHWLVHKEFCEEVVATKAEFDTSQQQQS